MTDTHVPVTMLDRDAATVLRGKPGDIRRACHLADIKVIWIGGSLSGFTIDARRAADFRAACHALHIVTRDGVTSDD